MPVTKSVRRTSSSSFAALGKSVYASGESLTDRLASRGDLSAVRGEMAAAIAHEIRQPLTAIIASADAAMNWLTKNPTEAKACLERIIAAGRRANEVVAGISSMFEGQVRKKAPLNINDVIRTTVMLAQDELKGGRVAVQACCSDDFPFVLGDRVQMQQVIFNLIMNAVDAMRLVTNRPRVLTISSVVFDGTCVEVTVKDSGKGIEPKILDRIFDPFFTTKPQGMGVGLAICRSIVEAHGGRLWASSEIDRETAFYILLPIAAQSSTATREIFER